MQVKKRDGYRCVVTGVIDDAIVDILTKEEKMDILATTASHILHRVVGVFGDADRQDSNVSFFKSFSLT